MATTTNKQWSTLLEKNDYSKEAFRQIPKEVIETDPDLLLDAVECDSTLLTEIPLALRTRGMAKILVKEYQVEYALVEIPAKHWTAAMYDMALRYTPVVCMKHMPEKEKTFSRCKRAWRNVDDDDKVALMDAMPESVVVSCSDKACKEKHDYRVIAYTKCGLKRISCKHSEAKDKVTEIHVASDCKDRKCERDMEESKKYFDRGDVEEEEEEEDDEEEDSDDE